MQHPVVIIGAGPVGLAAAAHAVERGMDVVVLEAGPDAGAAIGQWAHVRLFSPWRYLVDPTMRAALEATGWTMPDEDALPTGGELVARLLEPLAALPQLAPHLRRGHRVLAVTRRGYDKVKSAGRDEARVYSAAATSISIASVASGAPQSSSEAGVATP